MAELFILILAFLFGLYLGQRRFVAIQNKGEAVLSRVLQRNFKAPDYHLMNHVTIRIKDGTTQIDHILVSRFGVFVIETKDYSGWIYGDENQKRWTQVFFNKKFRFQNPIFQNMRHVRAVRLLLDFLPPDAIMSSVVFAGSAKFKTQMPSGVFTISQLVEFIRNQTEEVMSINRLQFCVGRLETERLSITQKTDIEHVQYLQRRHGRGA